MILRFVGVVLLGSLVPYVLIALPAIFLLHVNLVAAMLIGVVTGFIGGTIAMVVLMDWVEGS